MFIKNQTKQIMQTSRPKFVLTFSKQASLYPADTENLSTQPMRCRDSLDSNPIVFDYLDQKKDFHV